LPDLRWRDVDVIRARQVVVVRRSEESEPVRQYLEHALREDQPTLLGARLQDLEDQLLLAHAGRARHVEALGDFGQRADAHVLERRELDFFYFLRGDGARVWRRRTFFGGLLLFSRSISVHSCSNPSPVTA